MKKDLIYSLILHMSLAIGLVVITPFQPRINTDLGEVINVRLAAMPITQQVESPPAKKVEIPQAISAEDELAVLPDPKSITEAKKLKPKETPKPKKKEDKTYQPKNEKGKEEKAGTTNGQKDVGDEVMSGSRFGSAAVDNASFDYPYWFVQAFSKIEFNWRNPIYSTQSMECVVYFQVIRSGRVIKVEIEKSSGIDAFDGACVRAINLSKPLPPLPAEFVEEIIGIHLTFPYVPQ
ncbi:MAG: TonB family protein [Candidatus Zixiibacteriota bacterium]